MKIRIFSRQKAVKTSYKELEGSKVIISISDPDKNRANFNLQNNSIKAKLYLSFYDIDEDQLDIFRNSPVMEDSDAEKICNFVLNWQDKVDEIWVNCEMGVSRSAGIAAAISEHLGGNPQEILESLEYYPNKLCYNLVKDAFMTSKTDENVV